MGGVSGGWCVCVYEANRRLQHWVRLLSGWRVEERLLYDVQSYFCLFAPTSCCSKQIFWWLAFLSRSFCAASTPVLVWKTYFTDTLFGSLPRRNNERQKSGDDTPQTKNISSSTVSHQQVSICFSHHQGEERSEYWVWLYKGLSLCDYKM